MPNLELNLKLDNELLKRGIIKSKPEGNLIHRIMDSGAGKLGIGIKAHRSLDPLTESFPTNTFSVKIVVELLLSFPS